MSDYAAKGEDLRKQADKKLKGFSFGFGGNTKYEDAADLLEKAGNQFKLGKCWVEAGEVYQKLAEIHIKLDSKHDAAQAYLEAAKAVGKSRPAEAKPLLQLVVDLYTEMGRLSTAAKNLKEIAEMSEKAGQKAEAIAFYEKAADLYETDGGTSEMTKCRLKIAEMSAELGKYQKAVELFEEAAKRAVENNLLKFSARGYLLNAGICLVCYASATELEARIEKYRDIDIQFGGSREETLLEQLLESLQNQDEQLFATALREFDQVTRLDAWKTKILLEGKRRIGDMQLGVGGADDDEEEEEEEDDDVL